MSKEGRQRRGAAAGEELRWEDCVGYGREGGRWGKNE
uniref:Uncharacterized protein n=1 Tax=Arundo donax TaxID=35708 RepID=A0A0A9AXC0_ARUDO